MRGGRVMGGTCWGSKASRQGDGLGTADSLLFMVASEYENRFKGGFVF